MQQELLEKRLLITRDIKSAEWSEEDIINTLKSLNKAEKPNRCVSSMPQCPKLYDIKHCNAIHAIICIEVNVDQLNLLLLQPNAWDEMNCQLLSHDEITVD